jgi:phage gp29-like protein
MIEGVELPDRKFIVHRFGAKDGSPYGLGLGNKLFWPVFFKRQDIGFWLTFADKFGSAHGDRQVPARRAEAEQDKLLAALRAIASDVGIIVPGGHRGRAARGGALRLDRHLREARALHGRADVGVRARRDHDRRAQQGAGLGSGQANVHNEVRTEVSQADADLLTDTLKTFVAG